MTASAGSALAAAAFLGAVAPAAAAGTFQVPQGCTAYATAQLRSCQVSQHYRCPAEAPGDQWAVYMDSEGPHYISRIDSETRWIDSIDLETGERDRIATEADPASFSTLLATGRDDFDFTTRSDSGEVRRYVGHDRLTGASLAIDGVALERTEFDLTAYDAAGEMVWHRWGRQFIQRDWRIFYADTEEFENAFGDRDSVISTPVTFALPGETGFLSEDPEFDCDQMMAGVQP